MQLVGTFRQKKSLLTSAGINLRFIGCPGHNRWLYRLPPASTKYNEVLRQLWAAELSELTQHSNAKAAYVSTSTQRRVMSFLAMGRNVAFPPNSHNRGSSCHIWLTERHISFTKISKIKLVLRASNGNIFYWKYNWVFRLLSMGFEPPEYLIKIPKCACETSK